MKKFSAPTLLVITSATACVLASLTTAAPNPIPGPEPHRLQNISARARVLTGDRILIGGFIIEGNEPRQVMIRAIGPSLQNAGVPIVGRLADPTLELYAGGGSSPIASNDNWKESQEAAIAQAGFSMTSDLEAGILRTLPPGNYTTVMRGRNNSSGIGVVEVYDAGTRAGQKLANMSARAFVQTDSEVLIGGIIVGGGNDEDSVVRLVMRAIGPSLRSRGIMDSLANPTLTLIDRDGNQVAYNDDAGEEVNLELQETGLAPSDGLESAFVISLRAGAYTALVRGVNRTAGTALVEIFDAPARETPL